MLAGNSRKYTVSRKAGVGDGTASGMEKSMTVSWSILYAPSGLKGLDQEEVKIMPLEGDYIILREERPEDMELLVALRNDLDTQAWSRTLPPDTTEIMYMKRFEKREFSFSPEKGHFIIETKDNGEFAGTISYSGLEPRWSATIGIMVPKKFWGTGIAYEATEMLLEFLFQELGLRVVRLYTQSGNPRAVKLAEKSGFEVSVRQREAIFKNGELYDNLVMDMLREEYYAIHTDLKDKLPKANA